MKPYEKILICVAVALAAPPLVVMWWHSSHAEEPPLVLYLILPVAVPLAAGASAWAWHRSRGGAFIAPVVVFATCVGGTSLSNELGRSQVLSFCQRLLRAPASASSHVAELTLLAAAERPQCRIHDLTWGLWELGVYSGDQYVGYLGLLPDEGGSFLVAHAVPGGLR